MFTKYINLMKVHDGHHKIDEYRQTGYFSHIHVVNKFLALSISELVWVCALKGLCCC